MLGGYEHISQIDIQGSKHFFAKLKLGRAPPLRIADCGAGYDACSHFHSPNALTHVRSIGRVTKNFLSKINSEVVVDIIEPVKKFTDEISNPENFVEEKAAGKIGKIVNIGLEAWTPEEKAYWVIWK